MEGFVTLLRHRKRLLYIYAATFFLSFHYYVTAYVNSSFLSQFVTEETLSFLYVAGSLISILGLVFFTPLLRIVGNYRLLIFLVIAELAALLSLSFLHSPALLLIAFVFHQAIPVLILFTLDVFLENTNHSESKTGKLRGIFLTIINSALVISPLIMSALITDSNFSLVYLFSAFSLLPLLFIGFFKFSHFPEPSYRPFHILKTARSFFAEKNLRSVFAANLLLQLFYAWMVIYTPLYLRSIGISWENIGLIFTFMLLPFVLFELPLGRLADKRWGEKEIMVIGFFILVLSTALIGFITTPAALLWALLLFITRTGASLIEIMSETYFFKKVAGKDANLISFFRITMPLSFVLGPTLGVIIVAIFPLHFIFIISAFVLSTGILFALSLKDTL